MGRRWDCLCSATHGCFNRSARRLPTDFAQHSFATHSCKTALRTVTCKPFLAQVPSHTITSTASHKTNRLSKGYQKQASLLHFTYDRPLAANCDNCVPIAYTESAPRNKTHNRLWNNSRKPGDRNQLIVPVPCKRIPFIKKKPWNLTN